MVDPEVERLKKLLAEVSLELSDVTEALALALEQRDTWESIASDRERTIVSLVADRVRTGQSQGKPADEVFERLAKKP
jgi:hypothetical protein